MLTSLHGQLKSKPGRRLRRRQFSDALFVVFLLLLGCSASSPGQSQDRGKRAVGKGHGDRSSTSCIGSNKSDEKTTTDEHGDDGGGRPNETAFESRPVDLWSRGERERSGEQLQISGSVVGESRVGGCFCLVMTEFLRPSSLVRGHDQRFSASHHPHAPPADSLA